VHRHHRPLSGPGRADGQRKVETEAREAVRAKRAARGRRLQRRRGQTVRNDIRLRYRETPEPIERATEEGQVQVVLGQVRSRSARALRRLVDLVKGNLVEPTGRRREESVREEAVETEVAGRRWTCSEAGGAAVRIDGALSRDPKVARVELGLDLRKGCRRAIYRHRDVGERGVGQAPTTALSRVSSARVIAHTC